MTSGIQETINLQQIASNPKNSSWVFASAGSGKTKILTDRVLRLLLSGVTAEKILCLTFTKVAAAEMHSRINHELANWVISDDTKLEQRLFELNQTKPSASDLRNARNLFLEILDCESKIKIQTIHSFCQGILKSFPFESKISANFELLEENQEKLLLKKARQNIIQESLTKTNLQNLIKQLSERTSEESFEDLISEVLQNKDKFLSAKEEFFNIENISAEIFKCFAIKENQTSDDIFYEFIKDFNLEKLQYFTSQLEEGKSSKNLASAIEIRKFLQNQNLDNFYNLQSAFLTKENTPRKFFGQIAKELDLMEFSDDCCNKILATLDKINSLKIAQDTTLLLQYIDLILQNYQNLKVSGAFLDYNDIINKADQLLNNPDFKDWVRMKIDSSFDHILVDESQDTNHKQWNIIKALSDDFFAGESSSSRNRSIFIVGDEKQSIYSFQGAESHISSEIFNYFSQKSFGKLKKIELTNSFRSQPKILQAVDEVFSDINRQKSISQSNDFKGHRAIKTGKGKVEIWPQIKKEKDSEGETSFEWKLEFNEKSQSSEAEILSKIIAKRIHDKVSSNSANYGDFMILLRNKTNSLGKTLSRIFDQYQIPFSSVGAIHFDKNLLLQDLLSIAKFILLPQDDLNLACLLKSPFFDISEDDLLEICTIKNSNKTSIYAVLNQEDKYKNINKKLAEILAAAQNKNTFELFYFLLKDKNYERNFLNHFGNEALKISNQFLITLYDFCQNSSNNLQKFLEFINKLDVKISLNSFDNNSVKITTIHSAKGLQAPIVIIPDCCYNFHQLLATKEKISWIKHEKAEIPLWCNSKEDENEILQKHRQIKIKEVKDEYLRLLYVAMTRAENELYVSGFGKSQDPQSWYEIILNSLQCADKLTISDLEGEINIAEKNEAKNNVASSQEMKKQPILNNSSKNQKDSKLQIGLSQIKGRLIHKIMEIIGKNHQSNKTWLLEITQKIIEKEPFLDEKNKKIIYREISDFLNSNDFSSLFAGKIYCEVELKDSKENKLQRIDLLIEKDNEIIIIDYKSDENTQQIPQEYLEQLGSYKESVKMIYPKKEINSAIFWLKNLQLQFIK